MIFAARLPCLLLLTVTAAPAFAQAAPRYTLDPVHTRVVFAINHAGYSNALGTVSGSTGTLQFDPNDWSTAQLETSVPLQGLDLGDADWNHAALDMLNAKQFPEAHFVSTRIEAIDAQHASVFGNLTLHGITREVKLDVTFNQLKRFALPPFRRIAGFSAHATLHRSDFGINAWKTLVGDEVELRIEAEALRTHRNDDTPTIETAP
jgi:polyisoprenoid-binding protein YceI